MEQTASSEFDLYVSETSIQEDGDLESSESSVLDFHDQTNTTQKSSDKKEESSVELALVETINDSALETSYTDSYNSGCESSSEGNEKKCDPFVYNGKAVVYNTADCVELNTPTLIGLKKIPKEYNGDILVIKGDVDIDGNLASTKNIHADTMSANELATGTLTTENAFVQNALSVKNAMIENAFVKNIVVENQLTDSIYTDSDLIILPSDRYNVIYANSVNGPINIYLGTGSDAIFRSSQLITIKDVSLEVAPFSAHNINIIVPDGPTRIEYYNNGLTAGTNAGYALNSSGGAVTFRFVSLPLLGNTPTWVIESQFIGNPRVTPVSGMTFVQADDTLKGRVIRK